MILVILMVDTRSCSDYFSLESEEVAVISDGDVSTAEFPRSTFSGYMQALRAIVYSLFIIA